jgi:serine/threonine protein kinase
MVVRSRAAGVGSWSDRNPQPEGRRPTDIPAMNPRLAPHGPFQVGDRLGDLEIRGLLGKGGHAFVYDCFDRFLAKQVAVKVIPNPPHRGRDLVRRAREEARVLDRIDHPNVVRVNAAGKLPDGMVYIVMERLQGRSLREALQQLGRLTVPEALHVAWQIAEGVAAAHALGVIHRDLKPENVVLSTGNRVKILDFGVAKLLGCGIDTTHKELFHGTVLYMSPEHLQGYGVTFRSDVYALGTVLYELISGINPCLIDVEEPNMEALAWIQMARVPPRLERRVRGVPDYVARLVRRATAKQAAQRFSDMQEFADALRSALARFLRDAPPKQAAMRDLVEACGGSDAAPPPSTLASGTLPRASTAERSGTSTEGSVESAQTATDGAAPGPPGAADLVPPDTLPAPRVAPVFDLGCSSSTLDVAPPSSEPTPSEATPSARLRRGWVAARRRLPVFAAVTLGLGVGAAVGLMSGMAKRTAAASVLGSRASMVNALAGSFGGWSRRGASAAATRPASVRPNASSELVAAPEPRALPLRVAETDLGNDPLRSSAKLPGSLAVAARGTADAPRPESRRTMEPKIATDAERVRQRALVFEKETLVDEGHNASAPAEPGGAADHRPSF